MTRILRARAAILGIALVGICLARTANAAAQQEVAAAEQLKTQAFHALRGGQFDKTDELLKNAAALSHDPNDERMAGWASRFETQWQEVATERRQQFEKAAANVKMLIDKGHPDYALDAASRAYLLAANKEAFRNEPWVDALVKDSIARANAYDRNEQWIKAVRIYSDLGSLDPSVPEWKDKLKLSTRRVRLFLLYSPDAFKTIQDSEQKERDEVDQLLHPTTQPTTRPAADAAEDGFKTDWHDSLRGVRIDMLREALQDTKSHYFRDVSYKTLALGGLGGVRVLASTKGLEKAFPKLADAQARASFLDSVDQETQENKTAANEQVRLLNTLVNLRAANNRTIQLPDEVLVSEFADGAFGELDPFTSMIWPSEMEEFNKTTQGEFSGVGIQIQSDEDGSLRVVSPLEDTPAYKAGIKAGDIITHINGKGAKGITTAQAVRTITGPAHTKVTLSVRSPDGRSKDYTIVRETIKVASVKGWVHMPGGGWDYTIDPEQHIGYMRMTNFTHNTKDEMTAALDRMKQAGTRAIILDLRYNPGGLLTSAIDVVDQFIKKDGMIVSTRPDRDSGVESTEHHATNIAKNDLPLVVLVNQYSASASEIVSGALKDHQRALIVGERTFGKGSVQMLFRLQDGSAYLKLTTSHYYLPNGKCIHREENSKEWGVDPDVTVEMTPEQMRAAIDARQEVEVLRDAADPATVPVVDDKGPTTKPAKKDLLSSDPQLAAALLMLKLQLAGAPIMNTHS
jgi:carboxyl-terminal processing protease